MNRVEVKGGLTRDAEFRFAQSGVAVWSATIAVNGARWDAQARQQTVKTTFVRLVAFGSSAEGLAEAALLQGDEVLVVGELDQQERETQDGKKERHTAVLVWTVDVVRRNQRARATESSAPPW